MGIPLRHQISPEEWLKTEVSDEFEPTDVIVTAVPLPENVPVPASRPMSVSGQREMEIRDATPETPQPSADSGTIPGYPAAQEIARIAGAERSWLARLAAHLERRKRYPKAALTRKLAGMVQVRFTVAPDGAILARELIRSSGIPELDVEALDLVRRASPVPKPPPEASTLVTVPISFSLKS